MSQEEFRAYVIAEAKKYLTQETPKVSKEKPKVIESVVVPVKPSIAVSDITRLVDEMKKINKSIDLRNPLIFEGEGSMVESIIQEGKDALRERELDVDGINKQKHISFQNEAEKEKWNRMLKYDVPNDENRQ